MDKIKKAVGEAIKIIRAEFGARFEADNAEKNRIWLKSLSKFPPVIIQAAALQATHTLEWPPTIGKMIEIATKLQEGELYPKSAHEEWSIIISMLENWENQEQLDYHKSRLSPIGLYAYKAQKKMLYNLRNGNDFMHNQIKRDFFEIYNTALEQKNTWSKTPDVVRKFIKNENLLCDLNQNFKQLEEKK